MSNTMTQVNLSNGEINTLLRAVNDCMLYGAVSRHSDLEVALEGLRTKLTIIKDRSQELKKSN